MYTENVGAEFHKVGKGGQREERTVNKFGGGDSSDKVEFVCRGDWEEFDVVDCGGSFVGSVGLDSVVVGFSSVKGETE